MESLPSIEASERDIVDGVSKHMGDHTENSAKMELRADAVVADAMNRSWW